jgi:LPS export ABC transporter protein LptC
MRYFLKKHWPLVGMGALILVAGLYIFLAGKGFIGKAASDDMAAGEGIRLEDIHYSHNDPEKKVTWLLDAKEVSFSKDKRFMSFRTFRLEVQAQNRPRLELTGDKGTYDRDSGEVVLQGNLKGKTDNGYTVVTNYAVYNQKRGDLETEEPVTITGPFFSIQGRGLSYDMKKESLKIHSEVTTLIQSEKWIS